jgi:hypothetical protein
MTVTPKTNLAEVLLTDLWVHLGGIIAIAIGLGANKYLGTNFSSDTNLLFIVGGFAAMGLKLTNGTVAAVASAAADAVKQTAATQASVTLATAVQAATLLTEKQAAAPPAVPLPPIMPIPSVAPGPSVAP